MAKALGNPPDPNASAPVLDPTFVTTFSLLFGLVLLVMVLMTNEYRARYSIYTTEVSRERDHLDDIEAMEDANEQFQKVMESKFSGARAPQKLSLLARGLELSLPTSVTGSHWAWMGSGDERLGTNLLYEVFQTPDFVFVVMVVTSLLTLLFVFDSVCGEKQQGTLKLLLANSVPRDTVLLGKWVGGYISVVLPFFVAAFAGLVYIYFTGAVVLGDDDLTNLIMIFVAALIYISVFFTLGIMVSACTHHPSTSLLVCLLIWIGWILVIPNLAPVVARIIAPVPSLNSVKAEEHAIERETHLAIQRQTETMWESGALAEEAEARITAEGEQRKRRLQQVYQDEVNTQTRLSQNLARISPSASFLLAATRLAGTGPELARSFEAAQQRFQESAVEYGQSLQTRDVEWTRQGPTVKDPEWFDRDAIPHFEMHIEPSSDRIDGASFDLLLMVVYNAVFFMLAYAAFLRYDVS